MAEGTRIEWADVTWNPVTGCTPVSSGCAHCYAARMANRLRGRYGYPADEPFRVKVHPDKLREPYRWRKPRRVFVCSMGDLFHEDVEEEFIDEVFATMDGELGDGTNAKQHTYQLLTKRPTRMREYMEEFLDASADYHDGAWHIYVPQNVWLGVTSCNQTEADWDIPELLRTPAAVRFVSLEPLLGQIDLESLDCGEWWFDALRGIRREPGLPPFGGSPDYPRLDWVIVGAETGPGRRPCKLEWIESIVAQCREAEVPCFVKQIEINGRISHHPIEWPERLRVREFPA